MSFCRKISIQSLDRCGTSFAACYGYGEHLGARRAVITQAEDHTMGRLISYRLMPTRAARLVGDCMFGPLQGFW